MWSLFNLNAICWSMTKHLLIISTWLFPLWKVISVFWSAPPLVSKEFQMTLTSLALWHVSRYFFASCHSQITVLSPVISYRFHADTDWLLKNSLPLYLLHSLVLLHWQKERQQLRWLQVCQLNSLIFFTDSNSHQFALFTNIRSNKMGVMGWNWIWCPWDTARPSSTCHEPQCVQWCPECFHLWKWWLYSPYMADHLWQGSQSLGVVHVEYLVQDK